MTINRAKMFFQKSDKDEMLLFNRRFVGYFSFLLRFKFDEF